MRTRVNNLFDLVGRLPFPAACLLLWLWMAPPAAGNVRINEFLAVNDGLLQDEDGESPAWLELYNNGTNTVSLAGWHLTDNAAVLTQWTFPATNLPPGGYLVVFASGKNRTVAGAPLHTNFQPDNNGEYLALVAADGLTVVHDYAPAFPPQRFNVSYGLESQSFVTPLVATGATARVLAPASGALGLTWTAPAFNDATWLATNTPLGFTVGTVASPVLALDVNERGLDAAASTQPGFASFVINSNTSASAIQTQATTRSFGSLSVTVSNTAGFGYDDRLRATPVNSGTFTESLLLRDFIFSTDASSTGGLNVAISGLVSNQLHRLTVWSFDSGSPGNRTADWTVNGLLAAPGYTFNGSVLPVTNGQYRFQFETSADAAGSILLSGRRTPANTSYGVFLNALQIDRLSTAPATNALAALMLSNNASAYIRLSFTVADPNLFQLLKLRLRYNDGFVAYLNGQLVASRNAPASPQWNSTATAARSAVDTLVQEEIDLANTPGLLVPGLNVMAVHGLNIRAADADFLIDPELDGIVYGATALRYFPQPTPGAANGTGCLGLVADTKFSVHRGFYDTPFTVAITSATAAASIYWTTNGSIPSPTNGTVYASPVPVAGTTLLRAAAFLTNYVASVPDAHTYIFLSQVLRQSNSLPGYPTVWQASYPADYELDPNVVNHPNYGTTLSNDLRAIPTLSLVSDHDAFWNPATGIYVDATQDTPAWERAASVELFDGDNTSQFQINCAVQMHGNASRDNNRLAKHAFRLSFKSDYGPSKLDYNWFPGSVNRFDEILLLASFTDSWATRYSDQTVIPGGKGTRYRPEDSLYLRDVWMKDSFRDLGQLSARSSSVHLYVNGLYWGIYIPCERLDASFFSAHLGGNKADWDVVRDFTEVLDGNPDDWNAMMTLVNAGITSEAAYQALGQQVDIENLADYMLLHIFAQAEDWPHHNWYAAHRRANPVTGLPATKWIFAPWDQEIVLDQLVSRNRVDVSDNGPARIYSQLRAWPEFRRLFGDRVQKHLGDGGALTAGSNIARMQALAARIDRAIVGESARWGDAREFTIGSNPGHGQTFTRDEWWVPELQKLYTNFFPTLNDLTLSRLRAGSLYPNVGPPQFNQFGGAVSNGFGLVLTHTNTGGGIFYTLDGADPREYGTGAVSATAQAYAAPLLLNGPTLVRARVLKLGEWSALVEAMFYPPQDLSRLSLTEIMYHPPDLGAVSGNDLEFLELKNCGTNTLDLSGLSFSKGISFIFTNGTRLGAGQFFVLARNAAAFAAKYPGVAVGGTYTGQLDNGGEELRLSHPLGATIFSVTYADRLPWPATPDLADFSLVPRHPGASQAPDSGSSWRASANPGGSPGADDPEPITPPIVINELLIHTDLPQRDAVELYNPTASSVNLGGWFLTDDAGTPKKYRIPDPTLIPAGGYLVFDETAFNPTPGVGNSFSFSSTGEEAHLFCATAAGELTGYNHGVVFGAAFNGVSFGRYVNSAGEEFYPAQTSLTLGATNSGPRIGPVVISEIHYHPDANGDEFVELLNLSGSPVPLFDAVHPTNTWRLDGVAYTFPTNVTLGSNATLLVTATSPAAFRAKYNVPASVPIFGPCAGHLQGNGENLQLQAPDNPNADGSVPYVTLDAVRYNNKAPWPAAADGSGLSLQRLPPSAFGNEPLNWVAAAPTPGQSYDHADSDGDGLPDWWERAYGTLVYVPDADEDVDGDGLTNWQEFQAGTNPRDPQSRFDLNATATAGVVTLQFLAASNRTYSVLYQPALGNGVWNSLTNLPARSTNRMVMVPDGSSPGQARFYRLVTPAWP